MSYALAGPLDIAADPIAEAFVNAAYPKLQAKFEADAGAWVGAMKPYLNDALQELIAGESIATVKTELAAALFLTAVASAAGAWLLLKPA